MVRIGLLCASILLLTGSFASAMPEGMSANCQGHYKKYKAAKGPKAFATGAGWGCGWANRPEGTIGEAKQAALRYCSVHNSSCKVVETAQK